MVSPNTLTKEENTVKKSEEFLSCINSKFPIKVKIIISPKNKNRNQNSLININSNILIKGPKVTENLR